MQAKYYLLLAEPEHPTASTHKHLLYCEECGVNIQQQGFTIHNLLG
jgi:Fe2+ or Zn2+ uptake regulation protein